jgi:hypothetical protein
MVMTIMPSFVSWLTAAAEPVAAFSEFNNCPATAPLSVSLIGCED